jgi:hypothetical protein
MKGLPWRIPFLGILLLLAASCNAAPVQTVSTPGTIPDKNSLPSVQPGSISTLPSVQNAATAAPTSAVYVPAVIVPQASQAPAGKSTPATVGKLWLEIVSPANNAVVTTAEIDLKGRAPKGTVITINDDIQISPSSQEFSSRVSLEEGPNVIEIVASDPKGNEVSLFWVINFEP